MKIETLVFTKEEGNGRLKRLKREIEIEIKILVKWLTGDWAVPVPKAGAHVFLSEGSRLTLALTFVLDNDWLTG